MSLNRPLQVSPATPPERRRGFFSRSTAAPAPRAPLRPLWVVLLASLWMATACNVALWREIYRLPELSGAQALTLCVLLGLLLTLLIMALISLAAWRWTLKPVVTFFWISAAFGAYFMMSYGVVIDKTMIINALQTDVRETRDLLNWRLGVAVLFLAVAPGYWLWTQPIRFASAGRQLLSNAGVFVAALGAFAAVLFAFFQSIAPVMHDNTQVRYLINPLNSFYALGRVAAKPFEAGASAVLPLGEDAKLGAQYAAQTKPPLLILVLGETARSGNFAVNGYGRDTTPVLAKENIASQRNAWSCGTSTAASVPCMFSNLGREAYGSRPGNYEGVLDVLNRAGLAVLWIDNQSGCKGVCDRVANVPSVDAAHPPVASMCTGNECQDEIMLQGLEQRIAALPAEKRARGVVVVLHQMGSHGPAYSLRSPPAFKKFLPECTNSALQSCSTAEVLNVYDNSIVYTDHVLGRTIAWLKAQEAQNSTAMVYVSDHGESLGENNLYLHGMPYSVAPDVQKRVPWITWLSPQFEQRTRVTTACLQQQLDAPISHDNYFHSVLGLMNVQTVTYQPALDIYAQCRSS
jgi:lipid A ethanolaminephosphotransferase